MFNQVILQLKLLFVLWDLLSNVSIIQDFTDFKSRKQLFILFH